MQSIIMLHNRSLKKTEFVIRVKANFMAGTAQIEHDAIKSRVHARKNSARGETTGLTEYGLMYSYA